LLFVRVVHFEGLRIRTDAPDFKQGALIMTIKAINVRNQFKGVIKEIVQGEVVSEIDVQTASGIVTSVITTRSVRDLELKVGSEVIAFVKSTEVSIAKL
jgi:molybdopterin-binding protein